MKFFGFTIARTKALQGVGGNRGWGRIFESFAGAWQRNVEVDRKAVLAFHAVFSCMTLIASDIAKMRLKLVSLEDGVWSETRSPAYSPVLRKPNAFQNRIQFYENWVLSKLRHGNTYVLKLRDNRNVVTGLVVLDPDRVTPLISTDGSVYYELQDDNLAGLDGGGVVVPQAEIIHDRFNCLFHPLVGLSPIYACGLAATQGLSIQNNSTHFFQNGSRPGGVLTAPGKIDEDNARRLKEHWDNNYTGENAGKVAILGDGLQYTPMATNAADAKMVEQLGMTAEVVCSTFHVPPYKVGVGEMPKYDNIQALNVQYYSQCLQVLIESIELCLDEGLATGEELGTEFDLDGLLRMDSVTQIKVLKESAGILAIDEMRAKLDRKPVPGGDSVYLQQQNYSLEALAKRDQKDDPFAKGTAPAPQDEAEPANDNAAEAEAQRALATIRKGLA
ncbi:phage portal protein [Pelagerythrobacter marinus]|nr:phage portal protein [Pelagerythrobacter marinus]